MLRLAAGGKDDNTRAGLWLRSEMHGFSEALANRAPESRDLAPHPAASALTEGRDQKQGVSTDAGDTSAGRAAHDQRGPPRCAPRQGAVVAYGAGICTAVVPSGLACRHGGARQSASSRRALQMLVDASSRGVVQQALRTLAATSAAGGDLQPTLEALHGMRPVLAGQSDLAVRDLVADTHVHDDCTDVRFATGPRILLKRMVRNTDLVISIKASRCKGLR